MRSGARRAHLDRRRLPPVPESSPAGGPAALAHAVRAAAAGDPPPPGEHFRLSVRGLRVRELPAPCADQGAGGGVSAALTRRHTATGAPIGAWGWEFTNLKASYSQAKKLAGRRRVTQRGSAHSVRAGPTAA